MILITGTVLYGNPVTSPFYLFALEVKESLTVFAISTNFIKFG